MTMDDIIKSIKSLAENDQSIATTDITMWVDSAINRINQSLKANIPVTKGKSLSYVPEFDARFHECLVLFAVAKYRESDSDYNSSSYFMNQFDSMVLTMQRDMTILPSTRVDNDVVQIVVTDSTTYDYKLSIPYGSYFDSINIYQNNSLLDSKYYTINVTTQNVVFKGITLVVNDKLTIVFENNSDLNSPPYQWWGW